MALGLGIFLLVVGAILAFAIEYTVQGVDIQVIGYIMLAAGGLALMLSLITNQQQNTTTHREVHDRRDNTRSRRDDSGY